MRESLLTAGTVAIQLQRTDTKLLFIPVIFVVLRIWDALRLLVVSIVLPLGHCIVLSWLLVVLH